MKCIVATDRNYFLSFKMAIHSSVLVIKLTVVESFLFKAEIITMKLKASLYLNESLCIHPLTLVDDVRSFFYCMLYACVDNRMFKIML